MQAGAGGAGRVAELWDGEAHRVLKLVPQGGAEQCVLELAERSGLDSAQPFFPARTARLPLDAQLSVHVMERCTALPALASAAPSLFARLDFMVG